MSATQASSSGALIEVLRCSHSYVMKADTSYNRCHTFSESLSRPFMTIPSNEWLRDPSYARVGGGLLQGVCIIGSSVHALHHDLQGDLV
jgi:hypothetical protein